MKEKFWLKIILPEQIEGEGKSFQQTIDIKNRNGKSVKKEVIVGDSNYS